MRKYKMHSFGFPEKTSKTDGQLLIVDLPPDSCE
jgi:hypothetical protein